MKKAVEMADAMEVEMDAMKVELTEVMMAASKAETKAKKSVAELES